MPVMRFAEVKDRFEPCETPCDRCRFMDAVSGTAFPCSHCTHGRNKP